MRAARGRKQGSKVERHTEDGPDCDEMAGDSDWENTDNRCGSGSEGGAVTMQWNGRRS